MSHRLEIGRMDSVGEYTVLEAGDYEYWITSSRISFAGRRAERGVEPSFG
jgi:hypothetical protein